MATLASTVDRISPSATPPAPGQLQSTLTIYCRLPNPGSELRPAMTGYARISCGRKPAASILTEKILRTLRTEFWW